jgi:hypothetical protein
MSIATSTWRPGIGLAAAGFVWLAGGAGLLACGASSSESSGIAGGKGTTADGVGGGATTSTTTSGAGGGATTSTLPPEEHAESSFGAPVATGRYVWIANPASGRVAYIDARTLAIAVVEAGHAPTYLAAVPSKAGRDVAVVLNVLSRDATVLRAEAGALSTVTLPVPSSGNAWAVSPDGRWATAWTDASLVAAADPIDGYQDVTVLDLADGAERATPLTVGYRPRWVGYDAASKRAFAVTDDGVSVVDLTGPEPVVRANVALGDDPDGGVGARLVAISPDGALALVRREGSATIRVVSLADASRVDVALPGVATDLAIAADGSRAVAVVRDSGTVALLPLPGIASNPAAFTTFTVPGTTVGAVVLAPASPVGLLFTTAAPVAALTAFDGSANPPAPRPIALRAPVLAVFPTPDAAHAVVLHDALEAAGTRYAGALSVVPVRDALPSKILGLDAPPTSVAIAPDGDRALVATSDPTRSVYGLVVASMPSLRLDVHPLASEPIAAGIVAGEKRGFVAQKHPDGRITFVDFETGGTRTLTGFELASQVVDGSTP